MDQPNNSGSRVLGKFTPIDPPGPLSYLDGDATNNFRSGTYQSTVCTEPMTLYRLYGGDAKIDGQYWSREKPTIINDGQPNNLFYRVDNAVQTPWNTMTELATITVPPGTILYEGPAAPNKLNYSSLLGGANQVFIPRDVVKEIIVYNNENKANPEKIFKSQKTSIASWERDNYRLTDKTGRAINTAASGLIKNSAPLSLKNTNCSSTILSSSAAECKVQLQSLQCSAPSDAAREQRMRAESSLRADFCSRNNISPQQRFISVPWPGGVELTCGLPIFEIDGTPINSISSIQITGNHLYIKTKLLSLKAYKLRLPEPISDNELRCLQAACYETTKNGLMISVEIARDAMNITTDGLDHNRPGAKDISDTIFDADCLLGSLIFGWDVWTNNKTTSPVRTYENPFDVQYRLLRTQNTVTESESMRAQSDARKFSAINQQPKFVMNKSVRLVAMPDGTIQCSENVLDIALRGFYHDIYGNVYFDDSGKRCYNNHAFIRDFVKNYYSYMKEYKVLRRLHSYAIIIGILLNYSQRRTSKRFETQKQWSIERLLPNESEEHQKVKQKLCRLQESIIQEEQNECHKAFMSLSLANSWFEYDRPHARDIALGVLLNLAAGRFANDSELLRDILMRDACSIFVYTMVAEDNNRSDSDRLLTRNETSAYKELFGIGDNLPHPSFCSIEDALCVRAIEIALHISMKLDSWDTASTLVNCLKSALKNIHKLNGIEVGKVYDEKLLWSKLCKRTGEFREIHNCIDELSQRYVLDDTSFVTPTDIKTLQKLSNFLTKTNATDHQSKASPDTKKQANDFDEADVELIWLSALGYQLEYKVWLKRQQLAGDKAKAPATNECYLQFTSLMRSLAAAFCSASTSVIERQNMLWLAWYAVDQIDDIVNYLGRLHRITKLSSLFASLEKEVESLRELVGAPKSIIHQRALAILPLAHDARRLAEELHDRHVMSETANAMAYAYERLGNADNKALWERTSITDRLSEEKQ